ncbi:hypothetical protein Q8A67_008860 [Cirrhinus molitorella]|uniref:Uncharacterized protein n=1 Tax=Cirrhinus molitorella TaxID=172907 RepID=A0AA88Q5L3_9TELE|nr:hypothetical protein Q8A67_008860 [Cirrhinus molitorella]
MNVDAFLHQTVLCDIVLVSSFSREQGTRFPVEERAGLPSKEEIRARLNFTRHWGRAADRQTRPRDIRLLVRAHAVTLELSEGFQSVRVLLTVRQTRGRERQRTRSDHPEATHQTINSVSIMHVARICNL